ncbi:MAG: rhodanese-like domain-containing protein, partial [Clostridium baratii]|nr:rhodanese-like domain-containing protein [Clostridium baratii]
DEIPTDRPVYFICKSGNRSSHAITLLNDLDINNVINVRGGMLSWDGEIKSK